MLTLCALQMLVLLLLFCSFTIKETNYVLILVVQFSEVAAATTNMTDLSRHEYDWRL